jgi:hypothetical protein
MSNKYFWPKRQNVVNKVQIQRRKKKIIHLEIEFIDLTEFYWVEKMKVWLESQPRKRPRAKRVFTAMPELQENTF